MEDKIEVKVPTKLKPFLEDNPEKNLILYTVFELYRELKITIRQAADILGLNYWEMNELLGKYSVYRGYGDVEFEEELQYGLRGK